MKNNMSRRDFLRIGATAALACVALPLTGCGKDTKKLVLGDWYLEAPAACALRSTMTEPSIFRVLMEQESGRSLMTIN